MVTKTEHRERGAQPKRLLWSTLPGDGEVSPDRGCEFWARCVTCPWARCVAEDLPWQERREFAAALRVVRRYVLPVDAAR